jgi:CheY-like chemotaxis protein
MPEMDGFELLSLMQEDPRLKEIPVVIMSASEQREIIANCLCKIYIYTLLGIMAWQE